MYEELGPIPDHEYRFHFKSGRPSINFVTTVGERWRRSFERLRTPGDLGRWFTESGVLDRAPDVDAALLAKARLLREAIYRTAKQAGEGTPDSADLAEINRWAARPALVPELSSARGVSWSATEHVNPAEAALASLARDAIDLISGPLGTRVKECGRDDCALLFVDTSRPGNRRWCSMGGCGNKTKTAAYRRRAKAGR